MADEKKAWLDWHAGQTAIKKGTVTHVAVVKHPKKGVWYVQLKFVDGENDVIREVSSDAVKYYKAKVSALDLVDKMLGSLGPLRRISIKIPQSS